MNDSVDTVLYGSNEEMGDHTPSHSWLSGNTFRRFRVDSFSVVERLGIRCIRMALIDTHNRLELTSERLHVAAEVTKETLKCMHEKVKAIRHEVSDVRQFIGHFLTSVLNNLLNVTHKCFSIAIMKTVTCFQRRLNKLFTESCYQAQHISRLRERNNATAYQLSQLRKNVIYWGKEEELRVIHPMKFSLNKLKQKMQIELNYAFNYQIMEFSAQLIPKVVATILSFTQKNLDNLTTVCLARTEQLRFKMDNLELKFNRVKEVCSLRQLECQSQRGRIKKLQIENEILTKAVKSQQQETHILNDRMNRLTCELKKAKKASFRQRTIVRMKYGLENKKVRLLFKKRLASLKVERDSLDTEPVRQSIGVVTAVLCEDVEKEERMVVELKAVQQDLQYKLDELVRKHGEAKHTIEQLRASHEKAKKHAEKIEEEHVQQLKAIKGRILEDRRLHQQKLERLKQQIARLTQQSDNEPPATARSVAHHQPSN